MRFANPSILWLLFLTVPLVFFLLWTLQWRQTLLGRFATRKILESKSFLRNPVVQYLRFGLFILAFVMLVVALARPQWGFHERQVITQGVDLVVAIDTSASMMARDYPPTRLTRAKELLKNLIWEAKGDRVGVVAFAGSAAVMCPLTLDYDMAITALEAVDMNTISARGTDMSAAIEAASGAFEVSGANERILVLLTDGEQMERKAELEQALAKAKDTGTRIFAVGLGTEEGATIPTLRGPLRDSSGNVVTTKLDFPLLQRIASETNGEAIHAAKMGAAEIAQISAEIQKFRGRKQQDKTFRVYHERYPLFLAAALIFLVAEALLRSRRRLGRQSQASARVTAIAIGVGLLGLSASNLSAYPGEAFVHSRSALQNFNAGQYEKSTDEYGKAHEADPQNDLLTYNLGAAAAKSGQTSTAKEILSSVYDPDRPEINRRARFGVTTLTHREIRKDIAAVREGWMEEIAAGSTEPRTAIEAFMKQLKNVISEYQEILLEDPADADAKANLELAKRDMAELQKLLDSMQEQQQQQQQKEQPQENEDEKKDQQQSGGEDEQKQQSSEGESGQQKDQPDKGKQDKPEDQKQNEKNPGENEQKSGEEEPDENDQKPGDKEEKDQPADQSGEKSGQQQQPGDQGKPTPTPAAPQQPAGATPTPSPTPGPGPAGGQQQGETPDNPGEDVPVGQMSKGDVERLLNTLPPENQQALQRMMGGSQNQQQDLEHEW